MARLPVPAVLASFGKIDVVFDETVAVAESAVVPVSPPQLRT